MSRIIYLISVLSNIGGFAFISTVLSLMALVIGGVFYLDATGTMKESSDKTLVRFLKGVGVILVVSTLATVLIPSKEEMYMIALTKNYEVEDVYKMTKDEIKGSIDYVFDKIEELKNE